MFVKRLTLKVMTREGVVDELNVVVGAVTEGFCIIDIAVWTEQPIDVTVVAVPDGVKTRRSVSERTGMVSSDIQRDCWV